MVGNAAPELLIVAPTKRELVGLDTKRASNIRVEVAGLGEKAGLRLSNLVATERPRIVLSLGFAGALSSTLCTGDLLVCKAYHLYPGMKPDVDDAESPIIAADERLTDTITPALQTIGSRSTRGDILTTRTPILGSHDKYILGADTGCLAADMEGWWMAQAVAHPGVRLVSLRAVLDETVLNLPAFVTNIVADDGRREIMHVIRGLRRVDTWRSFWPLLTRSRIACKALREATAALIPSLLKAPQA